MLDTVSYRAAESAAKAQLPSWRSLQLHRLDAFEAVGFPSRVNSLGELGMFLNSMHEGRGDAYAKALGEFTPAEVDMLVRARAELRRFAESLFPQVPPSGQAGVLASLSIYRLLQSAKPDFKSILEIGPGCGHLTLFFSQPDAVRRYVQIEVCETFYLLQHMLNAWCYGARAEELVLGRKPGAYVTHVPWWHTGHIVPETFDLVTANACLLEMTPKALDQYLKLASKVLEPGGKFVAHCFGRWQNGNKDTLAKAFIDNGFEARVLDEPAPGKSLVWVGIWERV